MGSSTMDQLSPLSAAPRLAWARRFVLAGAAIGSALLLSGCDTDRVVALEERVKAVEAKADSAEKRAKAAESLAVSNQPQAISQPEPVPQVDENPDGDTTEPSVFEGEPGAPPPMADNGKG